MPHLRSSAAIWSQVVLEPMCREEEHSLLSCRIPRAALREGSLSSTFSSSSEEMDHNVWCSLLELFFHWQIGQCMEALVDEVSTARVALSCHFALDILCEK